MLLSWLLLQETKDQSHWGPLRYHVEHVSELTHQDREKLGIHSLLLPSLVKDWPEGSQSFCVAGTQSCGIRKCLRRRDGERQVG